MNDQVAYDPSTPADGTSISAGLRLAPPLAGACRALCGDGDIVRQGRAVLADQGVQPAPVNKTVDHAWGCC